MRRPTWLMPIVVSAGILLTLGLASACSSETDTEDLENRIAALEQGGNGSPDATQRTAMLLTLDILGTAGLHDIDTAANEDGEVLGGAAGPVDRAVLAVSTTPWPDDLQALADDLLVSLNELQGALGSDEPTADAVGPPAADAHEKQHDFEHEVSAAIAESAGLPPAEEEHEEEAATEPASSETPE